MRDRLLGFSVLMSLLLAACSSDTPAVHDSGKVVQPVKRVAVAGHLFATKGRALYEFSGTGVTTVAKGIQVRDPTVTPDGGRLAFAQIQGTSSVIAIGNGDGNETHSLTPASAPEGQLWAFGPAFSSDGSHLLYLTDRGKQRSSPQNLQPNDLGIWTYDMGSGATRQVAWPVPYSGGDSDAAYRPGSSDQIFYTTYLYGGQPLVPVARLTAMSITNGRPIFLSPDGARNFQPAVSPDGRFLAFVHATASGDDLSVVPLAASYSREVLPYPSDSAIVLQSGMVSHPVWAPDGSAIAFMMLFKGSFDLFILPVSTQGSIHAAGPASVITQGSFLDADSKLAWAP